MVPQYVIIVAHAGVTYSRVLQRKSIQPQADQHEHVMVMSLVRHPAVSGGPLLLRVHADQVTMVRAARALRLVPADLPGRVDVSVASSIQRDDGGAAQVCWWTSFVGAVLPAVTEGAGATVEMLHPQGGPGHRTVPPAVLQQCRPLCDVVERQ